ncbi:hypothetical protein ACFYN5_21300 [Streptomyces sp. NPDC007126]|uniref:hypothetical protein n=1 Tax=Streptomyces sp. NPDC007126 TaxID=3364774 RepID=UPI00368162CA
MAGLIPWIAPTFALAGVAVGAFLNPWETRRQSWQTARREAFDRAIAAVKAADLARHYPRHVEPGELGPDRQRADDFNAQLAIRGFERLAEAMHEMRQQLAALEPYLEPEWDDNQWPITDETAASLLAQLKRERQRVPLRVRRTITR